MSLGPIAGGIAASCSLESILLTFPIAIFTIFWISGFDILYTLQDFDYDIKSRTYSIPSYFGKKIAIIISSGCFFVSCLSILYYLCTNEFALLGYLFFLVLLFGFSVQILRSKASDFSFFKYNSYIGFLILILIISDILLR